jgi:hypothetical protein
MKFPQVSLRELFLLVALVTMGCGWWVERQSLSRDADRLREMADEKDLRILKLESELAGYMSPSAVYVRDRNGVLHDVTSKP